MHPGLLIMGLRRLVAALLLPIGMVVQMGPAMAEFQIHNTSSLVLTETSM